MTIDWIACTRTDIAVKSDIGMSMKELLGDELYGLIFDLILSTDMDPLKGSQRNASIFIKDMGKNQEETSSSSSHVRNEVQESTANTENPTSEQMQEIDGKHEEDEEVRKFNEELDSKVDIKNLLIKLLINLENVIKNEEKKVTENVEDQETTMASEWNLERIESAISRLKLFWKKVFGNVSESEEVTDREIRTAYESRLKELMDKKEEVSGSSSHGGNEGQESTQNVEKCAGNENGDQDLGENGENQEVERRAENVENLEVNPVIMEEAGYDLDREAWPTLGDASLVPYRRGRR